MRTRTLPRHARTGQLALGWRKARHGEDPDELYPVWPILGGAEDGDGGDSGDQGDGDQDGDDGGNSDKGSTGDDGKDWRAEAEKWQALARKHEQRAKENASAAKERDRLRREGLPEQERKIDEAVAKALAEERSKHGAKLARQAFLAAAKGAIENAAEVADDVNLSRYVGDDGEVDEAGLAELVKRLAPKKSGTDENDEDDDREGGRDTRRRRGRGFDQGARRSGGKGSGGGVAAGRELYASLLGKGADKS
ncbi:hypothetical protein [Streptomyces boncukensis]|uniref:Uncharacterized protein n=1 Tax=Streptomyces boncukensis TaxID=2711219 RepID=A0A6G4WT04_9ACTN|nr:hypothetical protein [Streptomyces boncukensis]NGO68238.1 hypothetical protein [Streptomyces boncukensis]